MPPTPLVGLTQYVEELIGHRLVDDLVEDFTKPRSDGLLPQASLIWRDRPFSRIRLPRALLGIFSRPWQLLSGSL